MSLLRAPEPAPKEVDLKRTYDAVVVGSGAAGGMAAHVLTSQGMDVLMLEAGKKVDTSTELKSLQWPYEHPRRGDIPYDTHALRQNEYTIRKPPYAPASSPWKSVQSYVQGWNFSDSTRNIVVNEKDHPYTGTNYAWVRARVLGGKTNIWGRLALRLSDYDFKAKSHDGYGEDWPISYADIAPYYDKVDLYLGISGHPEGIPYMPDGKYQRPTRLNTAEVMLRTSMAKRGRVLTPYRAGVTTDGVKHNKYRSRCFGRGACNRKVGGCDIHAAFDSPTGLIYPSLDTGHLTLRTGSICREVTVDPATGKARGVSFIDAKSGEVLEAKGKVVILAASTLESTRLMMLSKSAQHPNGIGNSSGHVGHNFCEHVMGPGIGGFVKELAGKPRTLDDGRPGGFYIARYRNLKDKQKDFLRAYGWEGSAGSEMFPDSAHSPGFGLAYKKIVREMAGATIGMGGFGEVLSRYENAVSIDPAVKDKWGIPVLKFDFKFGDNEKKMCEDMTNTAKEIFEEAGIEILGTDSKIRPEGWSIHELGTARMGSDPKTSVLNQYEQSHDVKNLFVMDGAAFTSASCQNPTWTIMALAWRSSEYLAEEMRKGNL